MADAQKKYTQEQMDIAFLKKEVVELSVTVNAMREDIKDLTAALNRGKGMFAGAMIVAGMLGAAFTKGLAYLTR